MGTSVGTGGCIPCLVHLCACNHHNNYSSFILLFHYAGPEPPTNVSVLVSGTHYSTVSWEGPQSKMCDVISYRYCVRYHRAHEPIAITHICGCTLYTQHANITLLDLVPFTEYKVSVAAIYASGKSGMSEFSDIKIATTATIGEIHIWHFMLNLSFFFT